jgi:hypothetical protein
MIATVYGISGWTYYQFSCNAHLVESMLRHFKPDWIIRWLINVLRFSFSDLFSPGNSEIGEKFSIFWGSAPRICLVLSPWGSGSNPLSIRFVLIEFLAFQSGAQASLFVLACGQCFIRLLPVSWVFLLHISLYSTSVCSLFVQLDSGEQVELQQVNINREYLAE